MDELDAIAARVLRHDGADGPWTLEVYPTLRCNLDCAFCDTTDRHRPAQAELPVDRWLALVDEAADLGARRIMVLGGGEPLLSVATLPLLRRARERGLIGMLTTNGTRLTPEVQDALVTIGWQEVHVSVDGADADTHDALRGKVGAFRRTVASTCRLRRLRDLRGASSPRLALHTVVTTRNVHQLADLVRLAAALGAFRVELDSLVAYRPEQRALALTAAQAAALPDLAAAAERVAADLGVETTHAALRATTVARGHQPPAATSTPGLAGAPCLKAWHHLVIQADGRTSPCCVLAGEGEPVTTQSLATVWREGPYLSGLRVAMQAHTPPPRCAECSENILTHERNIRSRLAVA